MQKVSRLIDSFTPSAYDLSLNLDRKARTFSGIVTIRGDSHTPNTLRLHAKDLTISSAHVDGREVTWQQHDNDELELTRSDLTPDSHTITIAFSGTITDQMHGLYPCYFTHDGVKKELLATQFESHHAREVFPCIDEPEAKATFDLTLTTETDVTALANMPVSSQQVEDERLITVFETTPRMSSYLLAWVVGELHSITATTKSGVEVNIWSTPNQPTKNLTFALDIATRSIDFYDEYFGITYPLPKSDHVALPDFSSGAMENWGLITYREVALLADPKTTSVSSKHYIATVIAHELAHQWFGNLVTMKWWNDLWLNESFATLMEYIAIDALHPEWNVWLDFASNESVMALRRDAIDGVQAVQVDVDHPDEINTLFDGAIVYAKGARLLHMLENFIGKEAFQAGLKKYFALHAYKNTEANDLWQVLSEASNKDIGSFMASWISQSGYPLVELRDTADGNVVITQSQFFIGEHASSSKHWPIPLGSSNHDVPLLLEPSSIQLSGIEYGTRLNETDSAHFITKYSPERLARILQTIQKQSPLARLQLLNEQSLLARGGKISSAELIPLFTSYRDESVECVWDIMALTFGELKKFVENNTAAEAKLRGLSRVIARQQFERLGWDELPGESETDTKLRATILAMMLYSEDEQVVDEALKRYREVSLDDLPAETRSLIVGTAVKFAEDDSIIDTLLHAYTETSSVDLKQDITSAITATRREAVIRRLLDASKNSSVIKQQDAFRWFIYLIRNRYGRTIAWQWLQENWGWVKQTYGGDKSYDDYPRYAATGLVTREHLDEYTTFFTPMKSEPALTRTIELGIKEIAARVDILERDSDAVQQALFDLDI